MQKLQINTFSTIVIPDGTGRGEKYTRTVRGFVKEYNQEERSYMLICMSNHQRSKAIKVRDKAICAVTSVKEAPPDLNNWTIQDCIVYLTYERSVIEFVTSTQRRQSSIGSTAWEEYISAYTNLCKDPREGRKKLALQYRQKYFSSRLVPTQAVKKSRTVMRRLRKKNKMRNDNSSVSRSKQKTTYMTPVQAINSLEIKEDGVATRVRKKSKKKLSIPDLEPVSDKPWDPYSIQILGSEETRITFPEAEDVDYGGSVSKAMASNIVFSMSKTAKGKKKKKKKLDIPF